MSLPPALSWTVNQGPDIQTVDRGGVHAALTRSKLTVYNKAPLFVDEPEAMMMAILAAKEAQAGAAAPETAMAQPPEQIWQWAACENGIWPMCTYTRQMCTYRQWSGTFFAPKSGGQDAIGTF